MIIVTKSVLCVTKGVLEVHWSKSVYYIVLTAYDNAFKIWFNRLHVCPLHKETLNFGIHVCDCYMVADTTEQSRTLQSF